MLHFQNIAIGYDKELFSIPQLTLNSGKLITLIGKNGAGKSTLFQSLLKNISPIKGSVLLENQRLAEIKSIAQKIAFVPSKFEGIQHLSVYDFIALARAPYTNFLGRLNEHDHSHIQEAIALLEIEHLSSKDTCELSDGERQIASIAKALVQETKIILLDEPSAFLDYQNKIKVLALLQKIAQEKDKCIIQSSHDLDLSLVYSDAFLIIDSVKKTLEYFDQKEISKAEILKIAFGI